jgi:hypothetical protein
MHLPIDQQLPTHKLAACFNNTSATYKYYWFLSILQEVENGNWEIAKNSLFARMISNAWYTVNYFHVSFGKQDLLQEVIAYVNEVEQIPIDLNQVDVYTKLVNSTNYQTQKHLRHFNKNVPHWFLSPWFSSMSKTDIYKASKTFSENSLYALYEEHIVINPAWVSYLTSNVKVIKDFCYWNLSLFLQSKNPNVPDIPNKLIKPAIRNSLNTQRTRFWDLVIKEIGELKCIYTGNKLTIGNYAVEHFIPYNFVSHDLIWNLIPADKVFNSRKSDKLPPMDKYFNPFFEMQKSAIEIITHLNPKNSLLEDYLTVFPDLKNVTKEKFKERIQPLITIASNNGFEFLS